MKQPHYRLCRRSSSRYLDLGELSVGDDETDNRGSVESSLAALDEALEAGLAHKAGFPGADDIDYSPL